MFDILRSLIKNNSDLGAARFLELDSEIRDKRLQKLIPIMDCQEPLIELPETIHQWSPHAYKKVGATYKNYSPFYLRQSIITALEEAQRILHEWRPEYQLIVFDGYRPLSVQEYMVDYTFQIFSEGKIVSDAQRAEIMKRVLSLWSPPSHDLADPPPHSTGAAVDLTILDDRQKPLDMGGNIDDLETAAPNIFYNDPAMQTAHNNRILLNDVMQKAGFTRLPFEWWHFSIGDQWAEYIACLDDVSHTPVARYGRYE